MDLPDSLQNLNSIWNLTKNKVCTYRYLTWEKESELMQPALEAVIIGETEKLLAELS